MKIKAIVWQEEDVWCGSVPALPGCHTWAESYEQLLEMLGDAVDKNILNQKSNYWLDICYEIG